MRISTAGSTKKNPLIRKSFDVFTEDIGLLSLVFCSGVSFLIMGSSFTQNIFSTIAEIMRDTAETAKLYLQAWLGIREETTRVKIRPTEVARDRRNIIFLRSLLTS